MYFSVKRPYRIAGKLYSPCICYDMPMQLRLTIERLVAADKAIISEEPIYFQSGARLVKEAKPVQRTKAERIEARRTKHSKRKAVEQAANPEPVEEPVVDAEPVEDVEQAGF